MKRTLLIAFFLAVLTTFSTWSSALAETTPNAVTTSETHQETLEIQQQISEQRLYLTQLKSLLNDTTFSEQSTTLLQKISNNTTLKTPPQPTLKNSVSIEAVTELNALNQTLDKHITAVKDHVQTLHQAQEQPQHINATLQGLQQLIENPLNQDKITDQDRADIPDLLRQSTTLSQQFDAAILQQKQTLIKLLTVRTEIDDYLQALHAQPDRNVGREEQKIATKPLQQQVTKYQTEALSLQNQLNERKRALSLAETQQLQEKIYRNQTLAWLTDIDIQLAEILNHVNYYQLSPSHLPIRQLEQQLTATNTALADLDHLKTTLENRHTTFKAHIAVNDSNANISQDFDQRFHAIDYQQLLLKEQPQRLTQLITQKKQTALFQPDKLYQDGNIKTAFSQLGDTLALMGYQIKISFNTLWQGILTNPAKLGGIALIYVLLAYLLLNVVSRRLARSNLRKGIELGIIPTLRKVLHIIRKHFYWFALLTACIALVQLSGISSPSDAIISTLFYGITAIFLWLELTAIEVKLNTIPRADARRSKVVGTLLIVCVVLYRLAVLSSADLPTMQLLEKVLMLSILGFTVVMKKNVYQYLQIEKSHLNPRLYQLYHRLIKFLPYFAILACALSLIGYSDLAWLILRYLGMGSLYLVSIAIGLVVIGVLRRKAKLYTLKRFEHGAFIAQDIVSPIAGIAKILWLWASTAILFVIAQWDSSSYLIANVLTALNYPLFSLSGNNITALSILLMILAIYLIFRVAKWIKTFSYHWLYSRVSDLGVRNSLSIFSQYVIALAGILIALKMLGIDLTSLAVFAGALGVGIGLGLQDIAKNFISGILLLIERPLRSGDWVAIDGSEGTVKSIGMRAITMETFDNQEVIIPNGNAISNSFTNYTHSNSLIRTVLYVGAGYDADPDSVIDILKNILARTDGILTDPRSQVVMWEYADSSINYRIQYYIDMDNSGLWDVKTAVLKAIWYDFKANNIEIPFPQRDINFRNGLTLETDKTEDKEKTQ